MHWKVPEREREEQGWKEWMMGRSDEERPPRVGSEGAGFWTLVRHRYATGTTVAVGLSICKKYLLLLDEGKNYFLSLERNMK